MRQPFSSYVSPFLSHINSDSPTTYDHIDFESRTQHLPSSYSSYQFTFCSWDNCCSEPAGAISCDQSGVSLTINGCIFNNCNSTDPNTNSNEPYNGGAICVIGISTFIISLSSFTKCCTPKQGHDNGGSGGIFAYGVTTTLSLSSSDLVSCFTSATGAGTYFQSIKTSAV